MACANAAENGHLECLKYLREEVKAPWDSSTASWAAQNGHLHILEYLVERKYDQYDEDACAYAAENGHLDCLKYLHETAKAPWDDEAVRERTRTTTPNVYNTSSTTTVLYQRLAIRRRRRYTLHKHIQTNKAFFNRDTHIQYTEMFALLKLFFFLF